MILVCGVTITAKRVCRLQGHLSLAVLRQTTAGKALLKGFDSDTSDNTTTPLANVKCTMALHLCSTFQVHCLATAL